MTTRQLAEKLNIVPATIVMYENGKHPIPYDVSIKLADVLEIEASLLYDDFSRFLAVPYTEALKSVRTALGLSQKAFAEQIGIVPSYYYSTQSTPRVMIPPLASHTRKVPERRAYKPQFRQKRKRSRSPAGPRRLRDSDAHKRIAVPKALCVLWEHPRPSPKSGKTCRSDTRPGDVGERAERSESSDTTLIRNAPCFGV